MGQYYKAVVIGENGGVVIPWDYDNGAKLMEHSWIGNNFCNAVYEQINQNPMLVGWIGDYSDDVGIDYGLYKMVWGAENTGLRHIEIEPENLFYSKTEDRHKGHGYLINRTKKEFIDLERYTELAGNDGWCINPLPILTSIGNGQGGGDYRGSNMWMVGKWYLDEIEFDEYMMPYSTYDDITTEAVFKEDWR